MTTRDDMIAALERMAKWNDRDSDGSRTDAALFCALADALREAQIKNEFDDSWANTMHTFWVIPEPKVKP